MKRPAGIILTLLLLSACQGGRLPEVEFITGFGTITAEIDSVHAPLTAGNFLKLVDENAFQDAIFYRVVRPDNQPVSKVKIEVVQGGLYADSLIESYPAIAHETTAATGILHRKGTLSMARNEPGTASTEFFFCMKDEPELDYGGQRNPDGQGFAAFGRVTGGMEVLQIIQALPDTAQYLIHPLPVLIRRKQ